MAELNYDPTAEATKKEALEFLGVSEGTLGNYVRKGRISVRYAKGATSKVALYPLDVLEAIKAENDGGLNTSSPSKVVENAKVLSPAITEVINPSKVSGTPKVSNPISTLATFESQTPAGQGSTDFVALMAEAYAESIRLSVGSDPVKLSAKTTVSPAEAAVITGLSEGVIRQAIKEGNLSAPKVGRGFRILTEDLEPWVKTFFGR